MRLGSAAPEARAEQASGGQQLRGLPTVPGADGRPLPGGPRAIARAA
ncbi:hypothetical protein [Rubricoccus marinus]|nr:hypothetical protein [Rubricoccus marinus]